MGIIQVLCSPKNKKKLTCAWFTPCAGLLIGNIKKEDVEISKEDLQRVHKVENGQLKSPTKVAGSKPIPDWFWKNVEQRSQSRWHADRHKEVRKKVVELQNCLRALRPPVEQPPGPVSEPPKIAVEQPPA